MNPNKPFSAAQAFTSSLELIATSYSLRCDAKYADTAFLDIQNIIRTQGAFELGVYLPVPFYKGVQHEYLDIPTDDSIPVINTLTIQNLKIRPADCRHVTRDAYDTLSEERKLQRGDVLLTVDGGTSIGKPALFDSEEEMTVDSHVVILRPKDLSPLALVYCLASPLGQMQFRRSESGASGQTTVTEDDIRRFIFPNSMLETIEQFAKDIERERGKIDAQRKKLDDAEALLWKKLDVF